MNNKIQKPEPETISFYGYKEIEDFIHRKYGLDRLVFRNAMKKFHPVEGQLLYLHVIDDIVYHKYDSKEELEWYKKLDEEFQGFLIVEWEEV